MQQLGCIGGYLPPERLPEPVSSNDPQAGLAEVLGELSRLQRLWSLNFRSYAVALLVKLSTPGYKTVLQQSNSNGTQPKSLYKKEKIMKRLTLTALAILGMVFLFTAVASAQGATASSNANARIISPISITNTAPLEFGNIAAGTLASVVRVTPAGVRSLVSGNAVLTGGGATPGASAFSVAGEPNRTYDITLPASITIVSGANNMTVDTFTSNPTPTGTLSGAGAQTLDVGADLHVGASQASGDYTGTFDVTVIYN